jgi:hypothetical protein
MDRAQSLKIIRDTFESKFDREVFIQFIVELLNLKSLSVSDYGISFYLNSVPNTYKPYINTFEKITRYHQNGSTLDILIIRLQKHTSIERARTMQRNFIAWYLKGGCDGEAKDAALAAFVSPDEKDWRFSLIRMDYSITEDKKGAAKLVEQFSPAKRWSFLVGANEKSHTAQAQLIDIVSKDDKDIKISELEAAFSVEKVTKEFFTKYRELFFKTKDALDEIIDKDIKVKSDFENKNISTVDFAKKLLGQIVFLYFLQKKGWFGVARDADWGTGPKNFIRQLFEGKHGKYNNFFNDILEPLFYEALRIDRSANDDYYDKFSCKIPFLNGGLFDPIGEYDWVHTDIKLPNKLFSNSELTKEGDKGTGIIDIFDRYNFTVQEDEPLEKEVAVDPEMLGKVFENLLEVKDRKSKGTYYTPREIVHYMCQQSLINYLSTELDDTVKREDIESLIKYGGHVGEDIDSAEKLKLDISSDISENASLIDEKLADIKVCDPAVGSGAFLVGMMSEIIRTRNALSRYIEGPYRSIYDLKRDCIEKCLYGVDIDPGAVEICKLRLWLSLIVDEEDIKQIKPLPNLDYKILCGNSLLGIDKQDMFIDYNLNQIEKLKLQYFSETDIGKKQEYKTQIEELLEEITNKHKIFDFKVYFSEVFKEKDGFDILIANPPYGEIIKENKDFFKDNYICNEGKFEIYKFFIEKGLKLLKSEGILSYITSNTWLRLEYFKKLREFITIEYDLYKITDSLDKVFESVTVDTVVFFIQKKDNTDKIVFVDSNLKNDILIFKNLHKSNYIIGLADNNSIITKLDNIQYKLSSVCDVTQGLIAYHSKNQKRIWSSNFKETEFHRPILIGRDVGKYIIKWSGEYLKYGNWLHRKRPEYVFNDEKILIQRIRNPKLPQRIIAAYDDEKFLNSNGLSNILKLENPKFEVSLKFILGILNSKLINYWFSYYYKDVNIKPAQLRNIPIMKASKNTQYLIISLVDKILFITKDKEYVNKSICHEQINEYEIKLDNAVYNLYEITPEEIDIIENSTKRLK